MSEEFLILKTNKEKIEMKYENLRTFNAQVRWRVCIQNTIANDHSIYYICTFYYLCAV